MGSFILSQRQSFQHSIQVPPSKITVRRILDSVNCVNAIKSIMINQQELDRYELSSRVLSAPRRFVHMLLSMKID